MTVFWLVRRAVSPALFYCRWPCSDWSVGRSRLHCSHVDDCVLTEQEVGIVSIVLLSMSVFWFIRGSASPPLFYCRWPYSNWSVGRSRLHNSIVDDRVLIDPWVGLASIVLLSMTVFCLIRSSVSPPLIYYRWPCSDWSEGRPRLHCSIVDDSVLIDP